MPTPRLDQARAQGLDDDELEFAAWLDLQEYRGRLVYTNSDEKVTTPLSVRLVGVLLVVALVVLISVNSC